VPLKAREFIEGTAILECESCSEDILVAPSTQKLNVPLLCMECAERATIKPGIVTHVLMTPEAKEEIRRAKERSDA
jgi:hypothetical protein